MKLRVCVAGCVGVSASACNSSLLVCGASSPARSTCCGYTVLARSWVFVRPSQPAPGDIGGRSSCYCQSLS